MLDLGSLVNFYTTAWIFKDAAREYKNPGVIIKVEPTTIGKNSYKYTVMWANKRITTEHQGYLKEVYDGSR